MCLVIWKMVSSAMTTWHNNNGLRTRVILGFVDQNVGWGTLHDLLHVTKKETLRGGHFMTYYTSSKYYGRTRMYDNIVPWALRALGTKTDVNLSLYLIWSTAPLYVALLKYCGSAMCLSLFCRFRWSFRLGPLLIVLLEKLCWGFRRGTELRAVRV